MQPSTDFSWLALFLAGLATVAQAYTTPVGNPSGNAIVKPGLAEQVPVGKPYTITWDPTTPTDDTVTILLLRGPSTNVVPLYPIVEGIKNTGTYSWTPKTNLEDDTTHYGLQLIVDSTGQYQYSTQFGISNPGYTGASSSLSASSSATVPGSYTSTRSVHLAHSSSSSSSSLSSYSSSSTSSSILSSSTVVHVASTGYPMHNTTTVLPTGTMTVPHSLKTTIKPHTSTSVVATTAAAGSTTAAASGTTTAPSSLPTAAAPVVKAAGALAGFVAMAVLAI